LVENTVRPGVELGGYSDRALRAQYLIEGETFEALFQLKGRKSDGGNAIFQSNLFVRGSNQIRPGFDFERYAQDGLADSYNDTFGASARLSFDLDGMRLISITGYESVDMFARGDVDGGFGASFAPPFGVGFIPFPAESGDGVSDHRQLTQEFRLESTTDSALDWQVGTLIYDEMLELDNVSYNTLANNTVNGLARQSQDNRAYALFGALGYQINDQWRINGGLRYTRDKKDFTAERLISPIGAGALAAQTVNPSASNVSGDLSVTYQATDDVSFYGRFANGFRAPSIQGRLLFGNTVSVAEEETLNSFELGFKSQFLDNRARLNVALFDYRVKDLQLTAVGGQANFNTLINADQANGRGIEIDLDAILFDGFTTSLGMSYNDTELDDKDLAVQPCGSGCTVRDPVGPRAGTVLIDGNALPQAPKFIGNWLARYEGSLGNGTWYAQTDWSYRTKVNFFLYESAEFTGDPLLQGGLKIGYIWGDGAYEAALVGRNIMDEIEAVGGVDFNNLTGFTNQPRYVGVEFSWKK
jgi:iron complex outermembrane recepter protein